MKYEMPVFTDTEKESLTGDVDVRLREGDWCDDIERLSMQIALATLTAEPDYQIEYRISQVTAWVSVTKETYDNATSNVKKRIVHVVEQHQ